LEFGSWSFSGCWNLELLWLSDYLRLILLHRGIFYKAFGAFYMTLFPKMSYKNG